MMIAHGFKGEVFGPAQRLHGATYVVDVEMSRADLDAAGIVVDIGRAGDTLGRRPQTLPEAVGQNQAVTLCLYLDIREFG